MIKRLVYYFTGKYSPKRRLKIYLELRDRLREANEDNDSMFMCYILKWGMSIDINYNDGKMPLLPELDEQRPNLPLGYGAWYEAFEYDKRVKNVNDAIELVKKKIK